MIKYRVTSDCDLMQIYEGNEVGTLGINLAPDTAELFASAPDMAEEIEKLRAELERIQAINGLWCEHHQIVDGCGVAKADGRWLLAERKIEQLCAELEAKEKEIGRMSRLCEAEEDHANWLEKQNKELRAELAERDKEVERLKEQLHLTNIDQFNSEADLSFTRSSYENMKSENEELLAELAEARAEIECLEEESEPMENLIGKLDHFVFKEYRNLSQYGPARGEGAEELPDIVRKLVEKIDKLQARIDNGNM